MINKYMYILDETAKHGMNSHRFFNTKIVFSEGSDHSLEKIVGLDW